MGNGARNYYAKFSMIWILNNLFLCIHSEKNWSLFCRPSLRTFHFVSFDQVLTFLWKQRIDSISISWTFLLLMKSRINSQLIWKFNIAKRSLDLCLIIFSSHPSIDNRKITFDLNIWMRGKNEFLNEINYLKTIYFHSRTNKHPLHLLHLAFVVEFLLVLLSSTCLQLKNEWFSLE